MDFQSLKSKVCEHIDRNRGFIAGLSRDLLHMPELGFKEYKSAGYVYDRLVALCGVENVKKGLAVTGVKATMPCGKKGGINLCLISELDAVLSPAASFADPLTGAAHTCGHHAQTAAALGAWEALLNAGIMAELSGTLTYMATPAEEYVELAYREKLREQGVITYLSGKQELIRLGAFDGIDAAIMVHAHNEKPPGYYFVGGNSLGFIAKAVEFIGREAHAGAAPHEGINALNAAMAALMCIHANRETFRDADNIRVHPIITKGGDLVNIVPASVTMETFVRGSGDKAVREAAAVVDRAIKGACYAIGAEAVIKDMPGYMPLLQDAYLTGLFAENAGLLTSTAEVVYGVDMTGSSDIGDVSHLMPTIQPTVGGFNGSPHQPGFTCPDEERFCTEAAKVMAMTAVDLLAGGAKRGLAMKQAFKPKYTKKEYMETLDSIFGKN
jgi:amidohydrolase